jgi:TolA-binding protein
MDRPVCWPYGYLWMACLAGCLGMAGGGHRLALGAESGTSSLGLLAKAVSPANASSQEGVRQAPEEVAQHVSPGVMAAPGTGMPPSGTLLIVHNLPPTVPNLAPPANTPHLPPPANTPQTGSFSGSASASAGGVGNPGVSGSIPSSAGGAVSPGVSGSPPWSAGGSGNPGVAGSGTPSASGSANPSALGAPVPSGPLDPAEEQYMLAVGLYGRGDWTLAAREFQSFLRQYPRHPHAARANFLLAETLLQLGQYEDALERFSEYLRQEPQGLWAGKAVFRSGEAAFFAGKSQQATTFLKDFLGRYPTDPLAAYALAYLGQIARKEKNWSAAADYFHQCLERFPQSPLQAECQLGLAQSWEALGKAEDALRLYQTVAQKDFGPIGQEAQFRLAALLYNLQRYPEATGAFQVYERRFPQAGQAAYARLYRGFALFHQKNWVEAEECFASLAGMISGRDPANQGPGGASAGSGQAGPRAAPAGAEHLGPKEDASGQAGSRLAGPGIVPHRSDGAAPGTSSTGCLPGFPALPANEQDRLRRQAQYWLGMVQRQQGRWADSAKTFAQLARTAASPAEQVECHFYAADGWLQAGNFREAIQQVDGALAGIAPQPAPAPAASEKSPPGASAGQPQEGSRLNPVDRLPQGSGVAGQPGENAGANPLSPWLDKLLRAKLQAAVLLGDHSLADRTAQEFFQRCAESPLAAETARWQAQSLLQRKQFQEAIRVLESWSARASEEDLACHIRYLLAYAYQAVGRFSEAEAQLALLLQAQNSQWKSVAQLAQAGILVAQKQYAQAVPLLEAYLASGAGRQDQSAAQAQLALCYAWLRQTEKAQELYKVLAREYSGASWFGAWTEQLAEAALQTGDFLWARSLFEQLAGQADAAGRQRALLGLGWTQYRAGQFPEASATLGRLLAMDKVPPSVVAEAAFLRATILAKLRQPDAALGLFEMVVDKYPDTQWFGPALLAAGRLQAQLGQHPQAAQCFQRYVQSFPQANDLDAALYDWAWSLKHLGQSEEVLKLFERIHREFPKSPYWAEATLRLAQQAYQTEQYDRADQLVGAVLAHAANSDLRPYALYLQIQIAAARDRWDNVAPLVQQLLREHPGSPLQVYAEFWQAELAFRKKDFATAEKLLEEFGKKYPAPPAGLAPLVALRQAQLLAHQRHWEEVIQAARRIRETYPQFDQLYEADYLLGRALAMKARFDEAREAFQRVIRSPQGAKTETAAMAQWYIGETYFHQRDYQTALRAYLLVDVLYAYPQWQALALLEAARCHQMLGQPEEAQKLYARLLAEFPDTAAAQQYRQSLPGPVGQPSAGPSQPTSAPEGLTPEGPTPESPAPKGLGPEGPASEPSTPKGHAGPTSPKSSSRRSIPGRWKYGNIYILPV